LLLRKRTQLGLTHWSYFAVDYILVAQQDVDPSPNPNEVNAIRWVKQSEIRDFCDEVEREGNGGLSPWFRLICDRLLVPKYWGNLAQIEAQADGQIHRYGHAL
jgi:isopentenyldiphosphate isomerase